MKLQPEQKTNSEPLQILSYEESTQFEPKTSFVWLYEGEYCSIECFGANHTKGQHSQLDQIKTQCLQFKPDCIVVEGYERLAGLYEMAPGTLQALYQKWDPDTMNEGAHGITLAEELQIPAFCPEPLLVDQVERLKDYFSLDEIMFYYSWRAVKSRNSGIEIEDALKRYSKYFESVTGIQYTANEFWLFFSTMFPGKSSFEDFTADEIEQSTWPRLAKTATRFRTHEIAAQLADIRDNHIVKELQKYSKLYKRVFIVYGRSHVPRWIPALEVITGVSKKEIPFYSVKEGYVPSVFSKDPCDTAMLQEALSSAEIDQGLVPFLQHFFELPITPRESCYGHADTGKEPYLSFVLDDIGGNESQLHTQQLFLHKISELETVINARLGDGAVVVVLDKQDHGAGPVDYTVQFKIKDGALYHEMGDGFFYVIWEEFTALVKDLK